MKLRHLLPCALLGLGTAFATAHADTVTQSGHFAADNSYYQYNFTVAGSENFSASTSSYATGGFIPVLTLFNASTKTAIDNNGSGLSDASLSDILGPGSYNLFLTEFPNVANGTPGETFLFAGDPNATGTVCGVGGGQFLDTIDCTTQRTSNYSVAVNTSAVTPEPASWLLVLPPVLFLATRMRRREA